LFALLLAAVAFLFHTTANDVAELDLFVVTHLSAHSLLAVSLETGAILLLLQCSGLLNLVRMVRRAVRVWWRGDGCNFTRDADRHHVRLDKIDLFQVE
jgi:hypothetical protein